jgi:hypothetical protein
VLEPFEQRRQRQEPRTVRRQLDCQREAVQARADRIDQPRLVLERAVSARGRRARDEQSRGILGAQRLHPVDVLGAQPQRCATRCQHGQIRNRSE